MSEVKKRKLQDLPLAKQKLDEIFPKVESPRGKLKDLHNSGVVMLPRDENSEVRKRAKSPNAGFGVKTNKLKFYFLTALVFTTFVVGLYVHLFQWGSSYSHNTSLLDSLTLTLGLTNYVHAVVIDAGSTGSRVLCYGFVSSSGGTSLKLHKEFFKEVKPGISAFANNPRESLKNLELLLENAKRIIPKEEWSKTSLVMKATAGLRLLPEQKANALLNEARKLFSNSGFRVDEGSVSIVDGNEEGLLSWFTVNFLLDRFGSDPSKTVVALDLGGGSTQVSFVPLKNDSLTSSHSQYLTTIAVFHKQLEVFTRSYLGLGLNEGRKRIFQFHSNHSTEITSPCINPLVKTTWSYGGVTYSIRGPEKPHYTRSEEKGEVFITPIVDFKECEGIVKNVISKFDKTPSLAGKEIFAFSYYYDRAIESGLIDFKKGGVVTLKDFISAAKAKCVEANVDQPFMCLDLVFISVLLRDTFSIPENSKINLVKWVDDHEVSWALGAAFLNLQNQQLS